MPPTQTTAPRICRASARAVMNWLSDREDLGAAGSARWPFARLYEPIWHDTSAENVVMTGPSGDGALTAPAVARTREPILAVLRRVLPAHGTVLEIASGSGEHAVHFAAGLPHLTWQPTDPDEAALR